MRASSNSSALLERPAEPLLGYDEPRIFTPPLRELTPETTAGFAVIEFASEVLGLDLLPWQKWLAIHALELLEDGSFRFRTVVLLVARQNGKSTFLQVLALFFLYVRGARMIIGAAQNLDIAEEVWQGAVDLAKDIDDLDAEIQQVVMVNGKKALVLTGGERYKVQAANRRGGRGLPADLVMLDELREHLNWLAWGALTKTTMARLYAQVWGVSNAGDRTSVVLRFLRRLAHFALGDPDGLADDEADTATQALDPDDDDLELDDESLGIFEWSAPPGCKVNDREGWRHANPSLGRTISERAIASAMRTDPEAVFRTEVLCQWVELVQETGVFGGAWPQLVRTDAARTGRVSYAVSVAPDRSWAAVAAAWRTPDGKVQVELVDYRPGTDWVADRVADVRYRRPGRVTASQSARGLVAGAHEPGTAEQALAHTRLDDLVQADDVRHNDDGALNTAVKAARWRPYGDSRMLDRKGQADISPLDAAALAVAGAAARKTPPAPVPVTTGAPDFMSSTGF